MNKSNIKIFVSHRIDLDSKILDNPLFIPVRCGAVYDKRENISMLGDNIGDNISEKRMFFNEFTVLYWAWKNQNADYFGLNHYRRFFDFTKSENITVKSGEHSNGCILQKNITEEFYNTYKLKDSNFIQNIITQYDAIFTKPINLKDFKIASNYKAMINATTWHHKKDVDLMLEIIKEKTPFIYETAKEYMFNYKYNYLYNCFIMKADIFNEYCEWLFKILFELESKIDTTGYTQQQCRAFGTLGERLTGIWALHLQKQNKKIKHLPLLYIAEPQQNKDLQPAFEQNNITIAMTSSNEYVPYLSVCLQSLKEHSNDNNNYDIVIFERNITNENKEILQKQIKKDNISLRFYNPVSLLEGYNLKFPPHYNLECYFRLTAPLIFKNYEKVIFTDVDLLFQKDIEELYNTDVTNYPLAAVQDYIWSIFINNTDYDWKKYAQEKLELKELYKYFNTGVMVLNVKEFNKNNYSKKLLEMVSETQFRILEQDGLNKFFKTNIKYIDSTWNFPVLNSVFKNMIDYMSFEFLDKYYKDKINPKIIHFAGQEKPWFYPNEEMANIWWSYARNTPFYEQILSNMIEHKINEQSSIVYKFKINCLNFWKYRLLQNITFGKKRKHYKNKKYMLKHQIKLAKKIMK